mmetsp:Transcript_60653/g.180419  ORF Transcript_60653/g.180419 Transcript_60653/m.180419 type:complete len:345 (-) Transcript_60653:505-1539(-)
MAGGRTLHAAERRATLPSSAARCPAAISRARARTLAVARLMRQTTTPCASAVEASTIEPPKKAGLLGWLKGERAPNEGGKESAKEGSKDGARDAPPPRASSQKEGRGPYPGGSKRSESALRVYTQGVLTKLSKGGFTANWNRRHFVLIGSTLFYAKDSEAIGVAPKVFVQLTRDCEVLSGADKATPHNNVFALRLPSTDAAEESELLLLAADSPREKFEWQEYLSRAIGKPRCPPERVAALMALQTVGSVQRAVIQAHVDDGAGVAPSTDRHHKPHHTPRTSNHRDRPPQSSSTHRHAAGASSSRNLPAASGSQAAAQAHGESKVESKDEGWFEKMMPDIFKNA